MHWFDAHLDLACVALEGRDMLADEPSGGANPPGAITFPTLRAGGVRAALATIFIEPDGTPDAIAYRSGDAESAHAAARRQIDLYHHWSTEPSRSEPAAPARVGLPVPLFPSHAPNLDASSSPISLAILVEGADGIRTPDELPWWVSRGVVAIGLAWAKQTRYAGGNGCETGLTDLGREMIRAMDRLGVVHDVTHLSDASLAELFERAEGPIIASHSNCRALLDDGTLALGPRQRHLTDDAIREIGRRGGMIGSVLFSPFIIRGGKRDRRATLAEWADHVERQCDLMGNRRQVGLGSDADGGFSALMLPEGIDRPRGYVRLAETLRDRGWSDAEVQGFAWGNWADFWQRVSRPR
jgi:membrane dipeptidase